MEKNKMPNEIHAWTGRYTCLGAWHKTEPQEDSTKYIRADLVPHTDHDTIVVKRSELEAMKCNGDLPEGIGYDQAIDDILKGRMK